MVVFLVVFSSRKGAATGNMGTAARASRNEEKERGKRGNYLGVFLLELFTWLQLKGVYMAEISPPKIISLLVTIRY